MKLSTVCLVVAVVLAVAGGVIYWVRTSPIPDQTTGYVNTDPKLCSPSRIGARIIQLPPA